MKSFNLFLLSYVLSFTICSAKWGASSKEDLVKYSSLIVVAEFVEITEESSKEGFSSQTAKLKITQTIKGIAPKELLVYGEKTDLCKAEYMFPNKKGGKYILFLRDHEGKHRVVNGPFGALTIINKQVPWFISDKVADISTRKAKDIHTVIYEIGLNSPPKKIAPKLSALTAKENLGQAIADLDNGKSKDLTLIRRGLIPNRHTDSAQCAQCLARHGSFEDVPYLIDALSDMSMHVGKKYPLVAMATTRFWANTALISITKTSFDYQWDASLEKRNYSIDQWTQYWKRNKGKHEAK